VILVFFAGDGFPAGDILVFGGRNGLESPGNFPFDGFGGSVFIDAGFSIAGDGAVTGSIFFDNADRVFFTNCPVYLDAQTNTGATVILFDPNPLSSSSLTIFPAASANGLFLYTDPLSTVVYTLLQPRIPLPSTIYSNINPYTNLNGAITELLTNLSFIVIGLLDHGLLI